MTNNIAPSYIIHTGPHEPCGNQYWTIVDAVTKHSSAKVVSTAGVPSVLSPSGPAGGG